MKDITINAIVEALPYLFEAFKKVYGYDISF